MIGPDRYRPACLVRRDVKPENILMGYLAGYARRMSKHDRLLAILNEHPTTKIPGVSWQPLIVSGVFGDPPEEGVILDCHEHQHQAREMLEAADNAVMMLRAYGVIEPEVDVETRRTPNPKMGFASVRIMKVADADLAAEPGRPVMTEAERKRSSHMGELHRQARSFFQSATGEDGPAGDSSIVRDSGVMLTVVAPSAAVALSWLVAVDKGLRARGVTKPEALIEVTLREDPGPTEWRDVHELVFTVPSSVLL